jgi:hypothetical protein
MNVFEIKEGHDPSSYFVFLGKRDNTTNIVEEFCIEETVVWKYLIHVLNKYVNYPFDYGDSKFLKSEKINNICNDIEELCDLLINDFNNPKLDEIKKNMSIIYFATDEERAELDIYKMSKEEKLKFFENNKDRLIDFYQRFVKRIKILSENSLPKKVVICPP